MTGNIWVLAEQWRGQLSGITCEALALGRELANRQGVALEAVLLGHRARDLAGTLGAADRVLYADHPQLAEPVPGTWAAALRQLAAEHQPCAVLMPLTNVSLGIGTLLGAQLKAPIINFCKDLTVQDGELRARCVLYGGKIETTVAPEGSPVIVGLWPGCRPREKGQSTRLPAIQDVVVTLPEREAVRLKKYVAPEAGDVDITRQEVLVAVGRGILSQENLAVAEDLAQALGGAVCGSRPVIDQGWLPLSRQVGKSGHTVKPKLYLAMGVSGAPEHTEGMRDAELIVAVNTDSRAPIFQVAHYGVVADALEIAPALAAAVRVRKEVAHHV
jgi:electron transfer flavoprotein alpha subunit